MALRNQLEYVSDTFQIHYSGSRLLNVNGSILCNSPIKVFNVLFLKHIT